MKTSVLAAAIFAGLSAAQLGDLPKCAQSCASEQFSGSGYAGCGTDAKCICESEGFLSSVACCLVGICDAADQAAAVEYAQQICSAQGVEVPTAVSCTTGTGATASATGSGSAATTGSVGGSSGTAAATTASTTAATTLSAATVAVSTSSSAAFAAQQTGMRGAAEILGGLVAAAALL